MKKKHVFLLLSSMILGAIMILIWEIVHAPATEIPRYPHYALLSQQEIVEQALANMIFIHGGSYQMGTNDKKYMTDDNTPAHKVILTGFYMSKYLTSGQQLDSYYQPTNQSDQILGIQIPDSHGPYPARISWKIANQYCHWLGQTTGLPFSLPTEAQWEYAARDGGKNIPYSTNNGQLEIGKNYPNQPELQKKHILYQIVTAYPVNALGLHQMGGNVSEWTTDWYDPDYYSESPIHNPNGPAQMGPDDIRQSGGGRKVARGFDILSYGEDDSQFQDMANYARSWEIVSDEVTLIDGDNYGYAYSNGFRCVINSDKPIPQLKEKTQA